MLHKSLLLIAMTAATTVAAQAVAKPHEDSPAAASTNPFFEPSTLPYQAPPFDKITDSDFQPAIEEGMKQQLAEVEKIANKPAAADVRQHHRGRWSAAASC